MCSEPRGFMACFWVGFLGTEAEGIEEKTDENQWKSSHTAEAKEAETIRKKYWK